MMRVMLFLFTNLAVIVLFGLLLKLAGLQLNSIHFLLITALIFGFCGSFISLIMSKWITLKLVDGEIIKKPRNNIECWLVDTISQQAKKVGITMPQVAIYPALDINAFATGVHRNSSLIGMSSGLLQNMNHDEAEAVIAHEISHIVNGDMVTMTLIQGIINTFVIFISRFLAQITTDFLNENQEEQNKEKEGNSLIYFSIATILELVFGVLASIITMWFSRYREFLADAGSARLVGKEKMIAALQRLKTSYEPQEEASVITFCINGKSNSFSELFMTHPSLDKRIKALRREDYVSKATN